MKSKCLGRQIGELLPVLYIRISFFFFLFWVSLPYTSSTEYQLPSISTSTVSTTLPPKQSKNHPIILFFPSTASVKPLH